MDAAFQAGKDAALADIKLRLHGLKCPLPVLKTRKALSQIAAGGLVTVECTDPLAAIDIPTLVAQRGDVLEDTSRDGEVLTFRIRKS